MRYFEFNFDRCFNRNDDIEDISELKSPEYQTYIEHIDEGLDRFVSDIIKEPIVWFDGRGEMGPRALGHRSILADPRNMESKRLLNKYKKRQWWRPVAPIVLETHLDEYFEDSFPSPYMLNNFKIRKEKRDLVPAILHLDDTCRVQSITRKQCDRLYTAMKKFYDESGIPIICNTSLNDKGEPIIEKIPEALNFALRNGIKVVYINGYRVALKNHAEYKKREPEKRKLAKYFELDESIAGNNSNNMPPMEFSLLMYMQSTSSNSDNEKNIEKTRKMYEKIQRLKSRQS